MNTNRKIYTKKHIGAGTAPLQNRAAEPCGRGCSKAGRWRQAVQADAGEQDRGEERHLLGVSQSFPTKIPCGGGNYAEKQENRGA